MTETTVTQDITLDCVDLTGNIRQLDAELAYAAHDPFAVQMTFHGPRVRASDRKLEAPAESAGQEEAAP